MEMDWGTAIFGLISVLLIIVPIVMLNYKRGKKEKEMLSILKRNAHQQLCNISKHEFCGDFVIGLDEKRKFVFFVKEGQDDELDQWIELSEIISCKVSKETRVDIDTSSGLGLTKQINLVFKPKDKGRSEIMLELYRMKNNSQLTGELQLAENWSKLINTLLKDI